MIGTQDLDAIIGSTVYSSDGDKIGKAGQVYLDDESGRPEWVTVNTGMFGTSESFVPLSEATFEGDRLTVPFSKDRIKDAPSIDTDGHLSPQQEDELYRYYSMSGTSGYAEGGVAETTTAGTADVATGTAGTAGTAGYADERGGPGHDTSGPNTDDAMTRSEERLRVGTENVETGRARLRKHVITENVTTTVPVTREEVRVEREPITDGNVGDATSGPTMSEEEHEVVLHEERPVVAKEAVPVERVRLTTDTVTAEETVSEEVRKEQIEEDGIDLTSSQERTTR